jgi:hypothetical protein
VLQCIGRLGGRTDVVVDVTEAVEIVMEVMAVNAENVSVKESVIQCLGDLSSQRGAVSTISDQNCVELIMNTVNEPTASKAMTSTTKKVWGRVASMDLLCVRLQRLLYCNPCCGIAAVVVVVQALHRITQNAIVSISTDRASGVDVDAIGKVLQANSVDAEMLTSCVDAINVCDGGEAVLWEVVAGAGASVAVSTEVLRRIASEATKALSAQAEAFRMAGVLKAVQRAMEAATAAAGTADEATHIETANQARLFAAQVLNGTVVTGDASAAFNKDGGLETAFEVCLPPCLDLPAGPPSRAGCGADVAVLSSCSF